MINIPPVILSVPIQLLRQRRADGRYGRSGLRQGHYGAKRYCSSLFSGAPSLYSILGKLANCLGKRSQQQGNIGDLGELTALYRSLLEVSLADRHARSCPWLLVQVPEAGRNFQQIG